MQGGDMQGGPKFFLSGLNGPSATVPTPHGAPYGVGRSRRRLQWIAPFIRGPQEAPFVATETANVWRR